MNKGFHSKEDWSVMVAMFLGIMTDIIVIWLLVFNIIDTYSECSIIGSMFIYMLYKSGIFFIMLMSLNLDTASESDKNSLILSFICPIYLSLFALIVIFSIELYED